MNKLSMSPEDKVLSQNYGQNYDEVLTNITGRAKRVSRVSSLDNRRNQKTPDKMRLSQVSFNSCFANATRKDVKQSKFPMKGA